MFPLRVYWMYSQTIEFVINWFVINKTVVPDFSAPCILCRGMVTDTDCSRYILQPPKMKRWPPPPWMPSFYTTGYKMLSRNMLVWNFMKTRSKLTSFKASNLHSCTVSLWDKDNLVLREWRFKLSKVILRITIKFAYHHETK